MLKMYLKIAWRSLAKNKFYSAVNIGGLTIGIASCILIGLYIANELSYDRFQKNADRLVRVTTEYTVNGVKNEVGQTASMPGPRLSAAFPEIESYVRMLSFEPHAVWFGDKNFVEPKFYYADSSFFSMFSFPLVEGSAIDALNAPNKIVISQSMERKYFGNETAIGKQLLVDGTKNLVVSGVANDAPAHPHIKPLLRVF